MKIARVVAAVVAGVIEREVANIAVATLELAGVV